MKKILIFGGTTEGKTIANKLSSNGIQCHVCVATEYGEQVMEGNPFLKIMVGRLDFNEMEKLFQENKYDAIIDATHPFAKIVSENILKGNQNNIPLFRFERKVNHIEYGSCSYFYDFNECIKELENTEGKIFLTTGSKNIDLFCRNNDIKKRLIARVIPSLESIKICYDNGLDGKQIVAMQGPFSKEMNLAQIKDLNVSILVTKESGKNGGFDEKIQAANESGIKCFIIKNECAEWKTGYKTEQIFSDYKSLYSSIEKKLDLQINKECFIEISMIGIGPGNPMDCTIAAREKIIEADFIFGAERMLNIFNTPAKKFSYYLAKDIIPEIKKIQNENDGIVKVVILFSGDTGFYSGAKKLLHELKEIKNVNVKMNAGLSSMQILASRYGMSWENFSFVSLHGVDEKIWKEKLLKKVLSEEKVFLLTSGCADVQKVGDFLIENGLQNIYDIYLGYNLSYEDEEVKLINAKDCEKVVKSGLYSLILSKKELACE